MFRINQLYLLIKKKIIIPSKQINIMKKKSTKRNLRIFAFLMFLLPLGAFAQTATTVNAYLCGTGTVKLTPNLAAIGYTPVNGDGIVWTVDGVAQASVAYNGSNAFYQIDASLVPGLHKYSVQIVPANTNLCPSTPSDMTVIAKLPPPVIAVNAPASVYCTDNVGAVAVKASNTATIPVEITGVTTQYVWTAKKGTDIITDLTTLGTISGDTFTLKGGIADGVYTFTAAGSYSTGGIQIVPADACTDSGSTTITVTVKPGKATISVAP